MTTPPPADLSRLGNILANARAVMNKAEIIAPKTPNKQIQEGYGNNDFYEAPQQRYTQQSSPMYNENDEKEMDFASYTPSVQANIYNYSDEQVRNSKMPEGIKKIMMEKRVPKLAGPPSKFTTEDLLVASGMGPNTGRQPITENRTTSQGEMINISKTQLTEMVNTMVEKKLLEFFAKSYNKMVTQETVKATITTLIKEGKIVPRKKTL